jgi:hypothetical protein
MDTQQSRKRRKGQTLAEFAITLPIVLIMMFGIIEFGRIFQAWVTLQNAARAAARYASTGQYNTSKYNMHLDDKQNHADDFIPCVDDKDPLYGGVEGGNRGTLNKDYLPNPGNPADKYQVYTGGIESIYATWNNGRDCQPGEDIDQERRKDMVRILSIMDEARRGAAGLLVESNPFTATPDPRQLTNWPMLEVWRKPLDRSNQRGWFNVNICSTRAFIEPQVDPKNPKEQHYYKYAAGGDVPYRFAQYLGAETQLYVKSNNADVTGENVPSCLLNEINISATDTNGLTNNVGKPWLDPGGPGDTVTIVVTFNHPLVTPLGLQPYIQMQARRSAIVESFRPPSAVAGLPPSGLPGTIGFPTDTPIPTTTPIPTATKTNTPTPRPTNTPTNTPSPQPDFVCSAIQIVSGPNIEPSRVSIQIRNGNLMDTFLTSVRFNWKTLTDYPNMAVTGLFLDGAPHWMGADKVPATDTNAPEASATMKLSDSLQQDRTIAAGDTGTWAAQFSNGYLQGNTKATDYGGTTFTFYNPKGGPDCVVSLPVVPDTPTPTFNPKAPTPTPTYTPDCASNLVKVQWAGFQQFGIVKLSIVNNRSVVAPLTNFRINWRQVAPGVLTLARVSVGAPPGYPGAVVIWQASTSSQDSTPPTVGKTKSGWPAADPAWVQDATIPANSVVPLYIDFDGTSSSLDTIGMTPQDFHDTAFDIGCGSGGSGGSGGGSNNGTINLAEPPTPGPTNTKGPTNTPTITYTPSNTPKPSLTPTKGPTSTPKPTSTPQPATNTPAPTPKPTLGPPPTEIGT